jgi:hypothetical protein
VALAQRKATNNEEVLSRDVMGRIRLSLMQKYTSDFQPTGADRQIRNSRHPVAFANRPLSF